VISGVNWKRNGIILPGIHFLVFDTFGIHFRNIFPHLVFLTLFLLLFAFIFPNYVVCVDRENIDDHPWLAEYTAEKVCMRRSRMSGKMFIAGSLTLLSSMSSKLCYIFD
jgi:hypothetical protein